MIRSLSLCLLSLALTAACAGPAERATGVKASFPAGGLVVTDMDGRATDLAEVMQAGRPVALVFWQTWCGSCLEEAPELVRAARAHGDDIAFFGVVPGPDGTVDDDEVRAVARRLGLPYPQIRDRDLALTRRYGVEGTPTILVLESQDALVYRGHHVPADWSALSRSPRRP